MMVRGERGRELYAIIFKDIIIVRWKWNGKNAFLVSEG